MKSLLLLSNLVFFSFITNAQLQIKPLSSGGYEKRIMDFIANMSVVDTHEHLMNPEKLRQKTSLDFTLLLQHYSAADLISTGMPDNTLKILLKDSLSIAEKWQLLKPYWQGSLNTSYNRVALLCADKLFNIKDINESTVTELSGKISKAYQTDWINEVIIKKCKIDFLIQDNDDRSFGNERFRYVKRFDNYISINSKQTISSIEKQLNISIQTLDDYVKALESAFKQATELGVAAVKTGLAYSRILYYENVSKEKAQEVFNTIMNSPANSLSFSDVKPLQDYMMHRVLDQAKAYNLPIAIHTGLQAGNGNIIENSNPTHLVNLIREYPDVNFVLYHGSYPYGGELATMAKNFKNVYIDLCWLYIISPSYSIRYLHEWLETVPASKIMAFGGDYQNVENVYGHLLFAKQIVSKVLIDKVKDGYLSESEAKNIAQMMFHDNAVNFYKLGR